MKNINDVTGLAEYAETRRRRKNIKNDDRETKGRATMEVNEIQ